MAKMMAVANADFPLGLQAVNGQSEKKPLQWIVLQRLYLSQSGGYRSDLRLEMV